MSWWVRGPGYLIVGVMIGVSIYMNFRFGFMQGSTLADAYIYGIAGAAADCFKALLPLVMFAWFRSGKFIIGTLAILVFAGCVSYSVASGIGFAAVNRMESLGARDAQVSGFKRLQRQLADAEKQLVRVAYARPVGVVQKEAAGILAERVFRTGKKRRSRGTVSRLTKDCTRSSRYEAANQHCQKYRTLMQEQEAAESAIRLRAQVAELDAKLSAAANTGKGTSRQSDPQGFLISRITGWNDENIRIGLSLATALLVELISQWGLLILGIQRQLQARGVAKESVAEASKKERPKSGNDFPEFPDLRLS